MLIIPCFRYYFINNDRHDITLTFKDRQSQKVCKTIRKPCLTWSRAAKHHQGGAVPAPSPVSMLQLAVVAVLVVPVSWVSQGGLEQTLWTVPEPVLVWSPPMVEVAVEGVLVVPVS